MSRSARVASGLGAASGLSGTLRGRELELVVVATGLGAMKGAAMHLSTAVAMTMFVMGEQ